MRRYRSSASPNSAPGEGFGAPDGFGTPVGEGDPGPDPLGPQAAARAKAMSRRPIGRYMRAISAKGNWVWWTWYMARWFRRQWHS